MEGLVCAVEWRLLNTSRRPDLNNYIYKWKSVARMIAFLSFANGHASSRRAGDWDWETEGARRGWGRKCQSRKCDQKQPIGRGTLIKWNSHLGWQTSPKDGDFKMLKSRFSSPSSPNQCSSQVKSELLTAVSFPASSSLWSSESVPKKFYSSGIEVLSVKEMLIISSLLGPGI